MFVPYQLSGMPFQHIGQPSVARQRVIRQYKIKKGDRCLPRINYFCIVNYAQALNL